MTDVSESGSARLEGGAWWRAETGIFLALWLYLSWLGQSQFLLDPGPFWSTILGQRILANGDVPRAEEFSCTFRGHPWNSHQWLAQLIMALLHGVGGLDTLAFATAVLLAALYTWVAHRLMSAGLHWLPAGMIVLLTVTASRYHLLTRPHLATIGLLGWTFARLVDFEGGKTSLRSLFWLPPIFILWSNLHGGALGGLGTVTLVILGWLGAWLLRLNSPICTGKEAAPVVLVLTACWLASLVNPYGWQLPRDWIGLMGSPVLPKYIEEHKPLNWQHPLHQAILFFGVVYLAALCNLTSWRQLRVSWILPLVWLVLTVQRVRHCTLFSITTAVALAEVLPQTRLAGWLAQTGSAFFRSPSASPTVRPTAFVFPAVLVLAGLCLQATGIQLPYLGRGWVHTDPGLTPFDLAETIDRHSRPGDAIFNELAYGGFLIYTAPQLRIFVDDRCELYGDPFLLQIFETRRAYRDAADEGLPPPDTLERWADQYGFRLALVIKTSGFDRYLAGRPDRWVMLGETKGTHLPGAVLYERKAK